MVRAAGNAESVAMAGVMVSNKRLTCLPFVFNVPEKRVMVVTRRIEHWQ